MPQPAHTDVYEYKFDHINSLTDLHSLDVSALEFGKNILYTLSLNGIKKLDGIAAKNIIGFKGSIIELNGLVDMSTEIAALLVQFKGALSLGIKSLEPNIAGIFQKHSGALTLTKIKSLSDESCTLIANYRGNVLEFKALERLSPYQAELLATYKGEYLMLGVKHISTPVADGLASYRGMLFLDGLAQISVDVANALSKHKGSISLDGLDFLSDTAAFALSTKKGKYMELKGLSSLSDKAILSLSKRQGKISLSGITEFSETEIKLIEESTNIDIMHCS